MGSTSQDISKYCMVYMIKKLPAILQVFQWK